MSAGDQNTDTALADCRRAIEMIDHRIVELLAERLELARRAKGIKLAAGRAIRDSVRELEVLRYALATARANGVPEEPVREIFTHVIGMARRAQETDA